MWGWEMGVYGLRHWSVLGLWAEDGMLDSCNCTSTYLQYVGGYVVYIAHIISYTLGNHFEVCTV